MDCNIFRPNFFGSLWVHADSDVWIGPILPLMLLLFLACVIPLMLGLILACVIPLSVRGLCGVFKIRGVPVLTWLLRCGQHLQASARRR